MACAFQAAFAIVSAVERRRRTGQGAELRLALADAAFTMLSHLGLTAEAELLDLDRQALGNHIYGAFGRDFGTKDGQRVMVAGISAGQWSALVKACGIEAAIAELERTTGRNLAQEARPLRSTRCDRGAHRALVRATHAGRSAEGARCESRVLGAVSLDARTDSRTTRASASAIPVWERVETTGIGTHLAAGTPIRAGQEPRGTIRPAPLLGQHTDEVLHEVLGLDSPGDRAAARRRSGRRPRPRSDAGALNTP